jgi:hypothetical protein
MTTAYRCNHDPLLAYIGKIHSSAGNLEQDICRSWLDVSTIGIEIARTLPGVGWL